jgi:hypothetical protein
VNKTLALNRGTVFAAWFMAAAAFAVPTAGPTPMIALVPPIGVTVMAPKPKPTDHDKVGPIPADNWDNDLPYKPDVDMTGYDDLAKAVADVAAKERAKHKKD